MEIRIKELTEYIKNSNERHEKKRIEEDVRNHQPSNSSKTESH